jgi:hypothetical protein
MALSIAEELESSSICSTIGDKVLQGVEFGYDAEGGDDVISLIVSLSVSSFEAMRGWSVSLVDKAIDFITEDTPDWDSLEYATSLIARLEGISDSAIRRAASNARYRIDDKMSEMALEAFERWAAVSDGASVRRPSEMERIVDYASQFVDAPEIFPAYVEAAYEVSRIREQEREHEREADRAIRPEQSHDSQMFDEAASVHNILGSLRESRE